MKKQILEYIDFMDSEIKSLDKKNDRTICDLALLNEKMVGDFRHERSVHLAITLFFASMTVIWFIVTLMLILIGPTEYLSPYMVIMLGVLTALFMVVDGFYIRHYYFLENSIQKLYKYNIVIYNLKTKE